MEAQGVSGGFTVPSWLWLYYVLLLVRHSRCEKVCISYGRLMKVLHAVHQLLLLLQRYSGVLEAEMGLIYHPYRHEVKTRGSYSSSS
jgi:hypothetical protein